MNIGGLSIAGRAVLAPMAGVTDRAFRELCMRFGAALVISEMVSSKGLQYNDRKTEQLMLLGAEEHPAAIQLFGCEPDAMALAAKKALAYGPELIDINMGCPAPKITGGGSGSALMKTPELCGELVAAVKAAVPVPVTVKIRKGWDGASVNAVRVAKLCEQAGADAITVHGRTRADQYAPPADWSIIRAVREAVAIPVIGNGDVTDAASAARMLEQTGCDAVMIGRGALGNPWVFQQVNAYLEHGASLPPPGLSERLAVLMRHVERMCAYKGESRAMNEARKHVGWYLKGLHGAAAFRRRAGALSSMDELADLVREIAAANAEGFTAQD